MAHYRNVMLGTISKLQPDLSGGSLPQRPVGRLASRCVLDISMPMVYSTDKLNLSVAVRYVKFNQNYPF